jgi:hypothetical protein
MNLVARIIKFNLLVFNEFQMIYLYIIIIIIFCLGPEIY